MSRLLTEIFAWVEGGLRFLPGAIGTRLRSAAYGMRLARRADGFSLGIGTILNSPENIRAGERLSVGEFCILSASDGDLKLGNRVSLNRNVAIVADFGEIKIGDDVLVGMNVVIRAADHRFDQTPRVPIRDQGHVAKPIVIGNDVWIGANVTIVAGVTIGDHVVVGAGAVVVSDVPSGSVAVGVPARVVRKSGQV